MHVAFQARLSAGHALVTQIEDLVTTTAGPFGPVHGHIGGMEDVLGSLVPMPGKGDPDAGADVQFVARNSERLVEGGVEANDDGVRTVRPGQILAQHNELVTGCLLYTSRCV